MPQRKKVDPRLVALKTRWTRARPKLDMPVTANFRPSAKLSEIRDQLEAATAAHLLIDQVTLAEAGRSVLSETSMAVEKEPLAEALTAALKPLGLGVRAIDEHTLQITTLEGLREHLELELYQVRNLVRGRTDVGGRFCRAAQDRVGRGALVRHGRPRRDGRRPGEPVAVGAAQSAGPAPVGRAVGPLACRAEGGPLIAVIRSVKIPCRVWFASP